MRTCPPHLASSRADVKLSAYIMERVLGTRMEQRPVSAGSFAANLRSFESVRDFIGSSTVVAFIDLPFALLFFVVIGWIAWPMLFPLLIVAVVGVVIGLAVPLVAGAGCGSLVASPRGGRLPRRRWRQHEGEGAVLEWQHALAPAASASGSSRCRPSTACATAVLRVCQRAPCSAGWRRHAGGWPPRLAMGRRGVSLAG